MMIKRSIAENEKVLIQSQKQTKFTCLAKNVRIISHDYNTRLVVVFEQNADKLAMFTRMLSYIDDTEARLSTYIFKLNSHVDTLSESSDES